MALQLYAPSPKHELKKIALAIAVVVAIVYGFLKL